MGWEFLLLRDLRREAYLRFCVPEIEREFRLPEQLVNKVSCRKRSEQVVLSKIAIVPMRQVRCSPCRHSIGKHHLGSPEQQSRLTITCTATA